MGIGILLAEGDEHKTQRKNLMPAFAYRHIKDLYPVFWSKSRDLVDHLSATVNASKEAAEQNGSLTHDEEKGGADEPAHRPDAIEVGDGKSLFELFIVSLSTVA